MKITLLITALLANFSLFVLAAYSQQSENWTKSPNGLESRKISILDSPGIAKQLFAVKINVARQGIKVIRAQDFGKRSMSAREICLASGALLCVNASFFDEKDNPLGLLISSGITFQRTHLSGDTLTGIFSSTRKNYMIVGREDLNTSLFIEGVQAGPRLVVNGKAVLEFKDTEVSRRAGVCLDKSGSPIFFITINDSWAITLKEFAEAMTSPGIDCQEGLNLDGGGSAQLFMRSANAKSLAADEVTYDFRGQDEVPVVLGVVEGLKF